MRMRVRVGVRVRMVEEEIRPKTATRPISPGVMEVIVVRGARRGTGIALR